VIDRRMNLTASPLALVSARWMRCESGSMDERNIPTNLEETEAA